MSVGPIGKNVAEAIKRVESEGVSADHYDMIWIKPLDTATLRHVADTYDRIITIEDGAKSGGFGSAVAEWLESNGCDAELVRMGVPDEWVMHGTVDELQHECGIDVEAIATELRRPISKNK